MRPSRAPIGLQLNRSARTVARAFDAALVEAGGSLPLWLVLLTLQSGHVANQRELAEAVGIREATLTNQLNSMDARGLVQRRRDPANRRVQLVELTSAGEELFTRLRGAAREFNRRLRGDIGEDELEQFRDVLDRLVANVAAAESADA